VTRWSALALALTLAGTLAGGGLLVACDDEYHPVCGNGIVDPNEECDDGHKWNNDGCSSVCTQEIAHTYLVANVGINRGVVPGYPEDSCASVAKLLVIDGLGPDGFQLAHQEIDCTKFGEFGWTYGDVPAGHYTVTMQLFDQDQGGNLTALTPPRDAEGDVAAGATTTIYVDFDFRDFTVAYTGNLKWQYAWSSGEAPDGGVADGGVTDGGVPGSVGCAAAVPATNKVRLTLRTDTGAVVNEVTSLGTHTNGSAAVACHDFGTSDAEIVSGLTWGIYRLRVEGLDPSNQVIYCGERDLFNTKGDGIIFRVVGMPGACP
jgi:cysteine-rich repeat protein